MSQTSAKHQNGHQNGQQIQLMGILFVLGLIAFHTTKETHVSKMQRKLMGQPYPVKSNHGPAMIKPWASHGPNMGLHGPAMGK